MADEKEKNEGVEWIPWKFRHKRPQNVPGHKDTSQFRTLEEGQSSCGKGEQCSYYSCERCSPRLALDILHPGYETEVEYIPRVSSIRPPDPFKQDKYHWKVFELYFRFFAQIRELKGVAVYRWSNVHATNVFENVASSFAGTRFHKTHFSIDWILFNGQTLTVIKVTAGHLNSQSSKQKRQKFLSKTINGTKRNQFVIQHLLDVTQCADVKINFVIACPGVSLGDAIANWLLTELGFVQTMTEQGHGVGFLSAEMMGRRSLYVWNEKTKDWIEKEFVDFINDSTNPNQLWETRYKFMVASVVLSMHRLVMCRETLTYKFPPKAGYVYTAKIGTRSGRIRHLIKRQILETENVLPQNLILGHGQLVILRSRSKRIVLMGEAGCGKSLVLLTFLFKYTSKYLTEDKCKSVWFIIPKEKTEFGKFLEDFITKHCNRDYVNLGYSTKQISKTPDILLIDEFPFCGLDETELLVDTKVVWSSAPLISVPFSCSLVVFDGWDVFLLRHAYRCPANISFRYTKMRRLCQRRKLFKHQPVLTFLKSGSLVIEEDSVRIIPLPSAVDFLNSPHFLPKKNNYGTRLLVEIGSSENEVSDVFPDKAVFTKLVDCFNHFIGCSCKVNINKKLIFEKILPFTGVEYEIVVIVINSSITCLTEETEAALFEVLYHAISRATNNLFIFCNKLFYDFVSHLLSLDELDLNIFMRLKEGRCISEGDLLNLLNTEEDILEALEILQITRNVEQLRTFTYFFASRVNRYHWFNEIMINESQIKRIVTEKLAESLLLFSSAEFLSIFFDRNCSPDLFRIAYTTSGESLAATDSRLKKDLRSQIKSLYRSQMAGLILTLEINEVLEFMVASVNWSDSETFSLCAARLKAIFEETENGQLDIIPGSKYLIVWCRPPGVSGRGDDLLKCVSLNYQSFDSENNLPFAETEASPWGSSKARFCSKECSVEKYYETIMILKLFQLNGNDLTIKDVHDTALFMATADGRKSEKFIQFGRALEHMMETYRRKITHDDSQVEISAKLTRFSAEDAQTGRLVSENSSSIELHGSSETLDGDSESGTNSQDEYQKSYISGNDEEAIPGELKTSEKLGVSQKLNEKYKKKEDANSLRLDWSRKLLEKLYSFADDLKHFLRDKKNRGRNRKGKKSKYDHSRSNEAVNSAEVDDDNTIQPLVFNETAMSLEATIENNVDDPAATTFVEVDQNREDSLPSVVTRDAPSTKILEIISTIRSQNSLKWMFSADVVDTKPLLEDKLRLNYYEFVQLLKESDRNGIVERFCKRIDRAVSDYGDDCNFHERLLEFWDRTNKLFAQIGSESGVDILSKLMIVLETTLEDFNICAVSNDILNAVIEFRSLDDFKAMFTKEVVYNLEATDDEGRYSYYKFLRFLKEQYSETAATYFCQNLHQTISEGNEMYNVHTVLTVFWTRINCMITDHFEAQHEEEDSCQRKLHLDNPEKFWAEIDELVEKYLIENNRFFYVSSFKCFLCKKWPSWFTKWYYLKIFGKSRFWRAHCAKRIPETGCYTACFAFNAVCQLAVIVFGCLFLYIFMDRISQR